MNNKRPVPPPSRVVALVRCEDYDEARVYDAVARGLELIGGAGQFVTAGERILLKVNLLAGVGPEKAVTTHPAVFRAVARLLADTGAVLSYGDSPGFGKPESVARRAGLVQVAEELGISFADFAEGETVSFSAGRQVKQFHIARGVLEADGVVSLPKLKTHALMRMTGAVKNQFGCIPGFLKGEFHARMAELDQFARMLADLTACVRPRLYIMDGVIAMEGNGPRNGTPRPVHAILLSANPVALDAAMCRIVGFPPESLLTNPAGRDAGLGDFDGIAWVGDPVDGFVVPDFNVNRTIDPHGKSLPRIAARLMRDLVIPRPTIEAILCSQCGTCVRVCPATPKAVDFRDGDKTVPPVYDYGRCLRCYCCQEMCPEEAIIVETPLLGRLLHRGK